MQKIIFSTPLQSAYPKKNSWRQRDAHLHGKHIFIIHLHLKKQSASESGGINLTTLLRKERHAKLLNTNSNNRLAKSIKSFFYIELADDMASYTEIHVGINISGRIDTIPPVPPY